MDGEWTAQEWQSWSDELAGQLPPDVDGDEAQEALVLSWVSRVGFVHTDRNDLAEGHRPDLRAHQDEARREVLRRWLDEGWRP